MNINTLNSASYANGLAGLALQDYYPQGQQNTNTQAANETQQKDSYIPSMMSMNMTFATTNYGPDGMMMGQVGQMNQMSQTQQMPQMPPMPQMAPVEGTEETETADDSTSTDFMQALQDAFRANADSIESTMDELGLTMDDLTDEANLTTLANAMNEGAQNIGVPTVDNLDQVISNLVDQLNGTSADDATETSQVSESSDTASSGSGSSSSSSDDETTTEVVTINGITYLETTTTENGVETTTRTVISTDDTV